MRSFNPRSAAPVQDNTGKASTPIAQNDSQLNSDPTDQSATNRKIGKNSASLQKVPRRVTVATWVVRLCFAFVFVVNVQCALGFALTPEAYMGAYELAGVPGRVATQGIGIAVRRQKVQTAAAAGQELTLLHLFSANGTNHCVTSSVGAVSNVKRPSLPARNSSSRMRAMRSVSTWAPRMRKPRLRPAFSSRS